MLKTARDLAVALGEYNKTSDYSYNVCCPAHNDGSPSLTITETREGRILLKCHAGCSQEAVINALIDRGLWEVKTKKTWKVLDKAPESQKDPNGMIHFKFGAPSRKWEYRNKKGELVGYTYRFDHENGNKEILPLAWCKCEEDGETAWRWKSFNKPRPLYNEHLIGQDKSKPILIVEGEKTADAAAIIFNDYIVITFAGGSNAIKFTNWEVLKGRDVTIWPDADEPGRKCASVLAEILVDVGSTAIKLVSLPEGLPKGWDLADEIPENVSMDRRALVITAATFTPSGDAKIDELNKRLGLAILGGQPVVIWEKWDHVKKRNIPDYVSLAAVRAYYANDFIQSGRKEVPAVEYWLQHPARKSYHSVVFEPGSEIPGAFNLWRGFMYTPDATGDWSLFEEHLRQNVARGDEDLYYWIIAWFAQMFQDPQHKPGTSLAIRGLQGSGKTVVGQHMGALVRDNYVLVDDPRYVLGNFNSHMGHALLLQADEGFFAGDPRHVGRLKGLVTSNTNRIEPKGKDSFEINNYMRLLITSNSDWIVPVAFEERRFAVIDCGNDRLQDKPFFIAMEAQLKNGGYDGLLHYLMTFDYKKYNPGVIPKTAALADQKSSSLTPVAQFWFERLRDGEIMPNCGEWPEAIPCEDLYVSFIERAMKRGLTRRMSDSQFGKELKDLLPGHDMARSKKTHYALDQWGMKVSKRLWFYDVPSLDACRASFDSEMGVTTPWEKIDEGTIMAESPTDLVPF